MADEIIKVLEYITNNELCQAVVLAFVFTWVFKGVARL